MSKRGNNEGSIYKREDGRWVAVLNLGYEGGKRKRKYFYGETRREVQEQLAAARRDHEQGLPVAIERQTIEHFLTRWFEETVQYRVRPKTLYSYKQLARLYIIPDLGRILLTKLTPQDVQRFLTKRLESGLSARTVQYCHAVLRRALNQALKWDFVPRNVATLVEVPRGEQTEQSFLTPEEARRFLEAIRGDRFEALYSVALAIGLRKSEALGLRWKDVDFSAQTVSVRVSLQWSGSKPVLSELKTRRSKRTIALPEFAVIALQKHKLRQERDAQRAMSSWKNELDLLFTTMIGTPLHDVNVSRYFRRVLVKAGIDRIRFYDLRHSCASLLIAQKVHPRLIMDILGHSDITVTMNTYGHIIHESREEAADYIHDILFPPESGE